jgi:uncharacterized membrane protein YhaH (DUF805 family)
MKWYFKALKQYATFNGRATRKEYWMFVLWNIILSIGIHIGRLDHRNWRRIRRVWQWRPCYGYGHGYCDPDERCL